MQEKPLSKTAYVLSRLREDLRTGVLNPGEQLRQVEIADRYGVSPTPVREALRLLEADGSILYSPHRGATVSELAPLERDDLYAIRSAIESLLTRLAAERATPEGLSRLRRLHEDLSEQSSRLSSEELWRLNREFHLAVMRLASPLLTEHVVAPLWQRFMPTSRSQWGTPESNQLFLSEHERLLEALEAKNPQAAEEAMSGHLSTAARLRKEAAELEAAE